MAVHKRFPSGWIFKAHTLVQTAHAYLRALDTWDGSKTAQTRMAQAEDDLRRATAPFDEKGKLL